MLDLKSCPFCGGEATHRRFTGNGFTLARVEYTQVSCQKCRIETEPDQPLGNEDRAATAWNRRTLQAVGPEPVAVRELHGPYGWLNGHRALSEDSWELENDPLENSDEYFAIPLYALTDPFAEIGKDGPRSALVATPPAERSAEPEFETAPDNGTPHEVLSYLLDCAKRWVPEARIVGNARAGDIERALELTLTPPAERVVEALRPFVTFADISVEKTDDGWVWKNLSQDRICDWFGPTDFGLLQHFAAALAAKDGRFEPLPAAPQQGGDE